MFNKLNGSKSNHTDDSLDSNNRFESNEHLSTQDKNYPKDIALNEKTITLQEDAKSSAIVHNIAPAPAHLPESMIHSVKQLPDTDKRLILFTRHSLRERSNGQGFASYDLPLTPKGRVLAKSWGRWLSDYLPFSLDTQSIASPIWRCVDTAKLMQEGAGIRQPVNHESLLVEPGSLVIDPQAANNVFKQYGALNFINSFLKNELDSTKSSKQGGLDILRLLYQSQPDSGHLSLAVSHDTLLAAFLGVMTERGTISWDDWPKMMEGMFLWFDEQPFEDATANIIWRGDKFEIPTSRLLNP